jgi:ATP-dependent RNA helicase DeaD
MFSTFQDLGLIPELLQTVTALEYVTPTPIQTAAIPYLLEGRDVIGQAQTGTGKTAAYALPMLQMLEPEGLQALILTPTRELAIQVSEALYRYGGAQGVRVLPVYGGQPYDRQVRRLEKGVHIVVGTPGRTLDLIRQHVLDLSHVRFLVLDEADEMLKMGFIEDVETILAATDASTRQTALFSATMPSPIRKLASHYMRDPLMVAITPEEVTVENITQRYYVVRESDKIAALSRLLEVEVMKNTLIFTRTKVGAAELSETLLSRGYLAESIHGDLPQNERERILGRFRNGQLTILVATDVVARGVDIPDVSHVINFDIPQLPIEYVHRIGRTGRAGRSGEAITLITPHQRGALRQIEDFISKRLSKGELPSREEVMRRRDGEFMDVLLRQMEETLLDPQTAELDALLDQGYAPELIAAAAIKLLRAREAQRPLEEILPIEDRRERRERQGAPQSNDKSTPRSKRDRNGFEPGMVRLLLNVGRSNGMRPGDIVYGIASAANIPGRSIGAIDIRQHETYLDVLEIHADAVLRAMKNGKIRGHALKLTRVEKKLAKAN